jgi:nucleoside phosphorylase
MEDSPETDAAPRATLPKTPVLITVATKWEYSPIAKAMGLKKFTEGRAEGVVAGRKVVLLKTGVGAKNAADALDCDFIPKEFGLTISAGLCGAMNPSAKAGDVVADVREADLDLVKPLRETALKLAVAFHFGKILHTNIVLQPSTKKALGEEQRAVACDMESAALRRWADGKTEVLAVRVVLDELNEACPSEVPGNETVGAQIKFALSRPGQLPLLMKTGWRAVRGMKTLAKFLAKYLEAL